MMRNYFKLLLIWTVLINGSYALNIVDCRVVTKSKELCNPYTTQLIYVKEIAYDIDRKKLIMQKSLPVPKVSKVKVISVLDMIDDYIDIQDSVRFEGTENISIEDINDTNDSNKTKVKKPKYGKYSIVSGDTLSIIASRFDMKTKELKRFNSISGNRPLRIGQELKLPFKQDIIDGIMSGEYKVKRGDTLSAIAHKFNLRVKDVIKYNRIKSNTIIRIGHIIKLPLPYIMLIEKRKREIEAKREAKLAKLKKKEARKRETINIMRGIGKRRLRVTATAYSSHRSQTDSTPFLAAWNNRIRPGMKIIAVSRDMLTRYGMRNGTRVKIGGLPGYYRVRDKMNKRYRKRIDIYMGMNRRKALRWGKRSVVIYW